MKIRDRVYGIYFDRVFRNLQHHRGNMFGVQPVPVNPPFTRFQLRMRNILKSSVEREMLEHT